MSNEVGHGGAQPTSHRRQREEQDSNQSNQRRVDETSATEDNNNSPSLSISQENLERLIEHAYLRSDRHNSDNDDDETEEEESSVSNEGWNSDQSNQHRLVDETSATEDGNNNNSSSSSFSQEDLERLAEQALQVVRQMDEMQNQQGMILILAVGELSVDNADGSVRTMQYTMRYPLSLNIDGMSYEELTELEERIGIVKTGLSKEIILKQLKTRVHTTSRDSTGEEETEICTVCQDKYENQDKIATLDCKHEYHQDCITKWLVRKNVCPICKGQALKTMEESKKEEVVNE